MIYLVIILALFIVVHSRVYHNGCVLIIKDAATENAKLKSDLEAANTKNRILQAIIDDLHKTYNPPNGKDAPKNKNPNLLLGNE